MTVEVRQPSTNWISVGLNAIKEASLLRTQHERTMLEIEAQRSNLVAQNLAQQQQLAAPDLNPVGAAPDQQFMGVSLTDNPGIAYAGVGLLAVVAFALIAK